MKWPEKVLVVAKYLDGLDIVTDPLYRITEVLHLIPSLAAVPLLLNVQIKYIFGSTFHRNIKVILLMYYSSALLHAVAFSIAKIYELISSVVNKGCDFFPPTYIHVPLYLSVAISNSGLVGYSNSCHVILPRGVASGSNSGSGASSAHKDVLTEKVNSLLAMCCERTVATIRSSKYESNGIALGVFFVLLTIVVVLGTMWYIHDKADFYTNMFTMTAVPPGAVEEFNQVAMLNLAISFFCIITFYVSARVNKRECSVGCATLTSRYQKRENVVTTQFAARIATLQVIFFILSGTGGLVSRIFGDQFFHSNKDLQICFRKITYLLPLFTLVLPIYSIRELKRYRLRREKIIRSIMTMESRGIAGFRNYEEVIAKSWQYNRRA